MVVCWCLLILFLFSTQFSHHLYHTDGDTAFDRRDRVRVCGIRIVDQHHDAGWHCRRNRRTGR